MAVIHALLAFVLISGLGSTSLPPAVDALRIFDLSRPPPPPPAIETPPASAKETQGEASPPDMKAEASPVVAPPPEVKLELPPPIAAAPVAALGLDTSLGSAPIEGPGTGSGGEGSGTGAGGAGTGPGGGGGSEAAVRTRRIRGHFTNADYPRAAERAGQEGVVVARLTIGVRGRVTDCRVRISSGSEDLDRTTCRLILKRFRFTPARDGKGRAIADLVDWEQTWSLRPEDSPEAAEAACRRQAARATDATGRRAAFLYCMAALGWTRG